MTTSAMANRGADRARHPTRNGMEAECNPAGESAQVQHSGNRRPATTRSQPFRDHESEVIHLAHSAFAERGKDLVRTESVTYGHAGGSGGQASPRNPPPPQYFTS